MITLLTIILMFAFVWYCFYQLFEQVEKLTQLNHEIKGQLHYLEIRLEG